MLAILVVVGSLSLLSSSSLSFPRAKSELRLFICVTLVFASPRFRFSNVTSPVSRMIVGIKWSNILKYYYIYIYIYILLNITHLTQCLAHTVTVFTDMNSTNELFTSQNCMLNNIFQVCWRREGFFCFHSQPRSFQLWNE